MAWFVAFGPAGAVVYYLAALLDGIWGRRADGGADAFGRFATRAFCWIDWVPVRLTAAGLAVVGNFEDAVYCWRMQANAWTPQGDGIILASGAGALGVPAIGSRRAARLGSWFPLRALRRALQYVFDSTFTVAPVH